MSAPSSLAPAEALARVESELRRASGLLAEVALEPREPPVFGPLAAEGPRAAPDPGRYAFAIEAIREGYLLHYGRPRVVATEDRDLALLAGDFLYALGLEQIAAMGDVEAIGELADLISACAAIHAADSEPGSAERAADERWRASALRVGGHAKR